MIVKRDPYFTLLMLLNACGRKTTYFKTTLKVLRLKCRIILNGLSNGFPKQEDKVRNIKKKKKKNQIFLPKKLKIAINIEIPIS